MGWARPVPRVPAWRCNRHTGSACGRGVREYSQEERARVGAERGAVDERDEQPRLRRAGVRACKRVRACTRLFVGARLCVCVCVWVRAPTWAGPVPVRCGRVSASASAGARARALRRNSCGNAWLYKLHIHIYLCVRVKKIMGTSMYSSRGCGSASTTAAALRKLRPLGVPRLGARWRGVGTAGVGRTLPVPRPCSAARRADGAHVTGYPESTQ